MNRRSSGYEPGAGATPVHSAIWEENAGVIDAPRPAGRGDDRKRWKPEGGQPPSLRGACLARSRSLPVAVAPPFGGAVLGWCAPLVVHRPIKNPPARKLGGFVEPMLQLSASIESSRASGEAMKGLPRPFRLPDCHRRAIAIPAIADQTERGAA